MSHVSHDSPGEVCSHCKWKMAVLIPDLVLESPAEFLHFHSLPGQNDISAVTNIYSRPLVLHSCVVQPTQVCSSKRYYFQMMAWHEFEMFVQACTSFPSNTTTHQCHFQSCLYILSTSCRWPCCESCPAPLSRWEASGSESLLKIHYHPSLNMWWPVMFYWWAVFLQHWEAFIHSL